MEEETKWENYSDQEETTETKENRRRELTNHNHSSGTRRKGNKYDEMEELKKEIKRLQTEQTKVQQEVKEFNK